MRKIFLFLIPLFIWGQSGKIYFVNGDIQNFTSIDGVTGSHENGKSTYSYKGFGILYNSTYREIPFSKIKTIEFGKYEKATKKDYVDGGEKHLRNTSVTITLKNGKEVINNIKYLYYLKNVGYYDDLTEETVTQSSIQFIEPKPGNYGYIKAINKLEFD